MAPLSLALGYEDIRTPTITICRNDFCLGGGLDLGADAPKLGMGYGTTFVSQDPASPGSSATAMLRGSTAASFELEVWWRETSTNAPLPTGDAYRVTLVSSQGATLASFSGMVKSYIDTLPNGPGCDPICRTAKIEA